jgi:hypothetical protein
MALLMTTPEQLANRLTKAFQLDLKLAIENHMREYAKQIIAAAAEECAGHLKTMIQSYEDFPNQSLHIQVKIDGVTKEL